MGTCLSWAHFPLWSPLSWMIVRFEIGTSVCSVFFRTVWYNNKVRRTRLVGLSVLNGVAFSEALFNCGNRHFKDQVTTIVVALMAIIFEVDITELDHV